MKTPPHSAEAERGIIGSILLDTQFGEDARVLDLCQARGLTPDSFYEPRNRLLYETFREMSGDSAPIDAVTLADRIPESRISSARKSFTLTPMLRA